MSRKKKINLLPHERDALVKIYLEFRIPIGQFQKRPAEMDAFVNEWRRRTGRNDTAGELIHYMRNQRKQKLWVRLEDKALKAPPHEQFSADEVELLVELYGKYVIAAGDGSDVLDQEPEVAQNIAKEFATVTHRVIAPTFITAKLALLRRHGMLPKVGRSVSHAGDKGEAAFNDIDQALRKASGE
jgi:hypothetical protein